MTFKPAGLFSAFALGLAILMGGAAKSAATDSFYAGKVVTIVVGSSAGSIYDLYVRTLAQFLPNFIPGHPSIIVENMPAANGDQAVAHMFNMAARDGTVIASGVSPMAIRPLLHPDISKYDASKLSWIGSITKDIYIAYVWHTAPIRTYEEAKQTQAIMGGISIGAPNVDLAVVSNALFGTKFKIVPGYVSESTIELAVEKGEVQGSFAGGYSGIKSGQPEWFRDGKITIILQHGLDRLPDLSDVPLFVDQAKTPEDRQTVQFLAAPQEMAKPFYAPPGIPADRLDILRRAFDGTVRDPGFLATAAKAHMAVTGSMDGEELAAAVSRVTNTPPAVIDRIKGILANFAQK